MNKKFFTLMSFLVLISFLFIYSACNQGTSSINQSPTDYVTITDINSRITDADVKAGTEKTNGYMPPVKMSHKKHEDSGVNCFTCHHKKDNDDRIKQCAACHKGKKADATLHNICMNCHLEKKLGPVMCQDCHKEQEKK